METVLGLVCSSSHTVTLVGSSKIVLCLTDTKMVSLQVCYRFDRFTTKGVTIPAIMKAEIRVTTDHNEMKERLLKTHADYSFSDEDFRFAHSHP